MGVLEFVRNLGRLVSNNEYELMIRKCQIIRTVPIQYIGAMPSFDEFMTVFLNLN